MTIAIGSVAVFCILLATSCFAKECPVLSGEGATALFPNTIGDGQIRPQQPSVSTIFGTSVKADTLPVSSATLGSVATLFPSSTSRTSSGYNGACSRTAPCTGDITYYDTANTTEHPSFCGTTNNGLTEFVLAMSQGIITESDCGRSVTITLNGVTKTGTIVDKCVGCDHNSIDLSRALFEALAGSLDAGRISGVQWHVD